MPIAIKLLVVSDRDGQAAEVREQLVAAGFEVELESVSLAKAVTPAIGAGHWDVACIRGHLDEAAVLPIIHAIRHHSPGTHCYVIAEPGGESSAVASQHAGAYHFISLARLSELPAAVSAARKETGSRCCVTTPALFDCPIFLTNILATAPLEIVVRDADSRIVFVNEAFSRFYGCCPADMLGLLDKDIWFMYGRSPVQIDDWLTQDRHVLETGDTLEYVQEIIRASGEVVFFHNIKKVITHSDGTRYLMAMYTDITEQQRAENKLSEARRAEAELAGIRKITATYAHEINNPLTGILGLAQILLEDNGDDESAEEMLTEIQAAARRIKHVIQKMESISHPKTRPYLERAELIDLRDDA